MGIDLHWVGDDAADLDRVAETRLLCYSSATKNRESFRQRLRDDGRATGGDYLLATDATGRAVGTATHLSLDLWVRGGRVSCQGVAWVGAVKTMRRRGGDEPGVATSVMREIVRHARDRGDVCSALMPFRVSFYEHFGYGIVERRQEWTVDAAVLPRGAFDGIRFYESATDFVARADCLRRVNRSGQCDPERIDAQWRSVDAAADEGLQVVDRPTDGGPVLGSMTLFSHHADGRHVLRVGEAVYEDVAGLRRQLCFLASLRDQYGAVQVTLPADVPLNWLLREPQVPHRPVDHPHATARPYTRMQVRVLDHLRFLGAMSWPADVRGRAVVAVHECEGHESRFAVDVADGRATVTAADQSPTFTCPDRVWAAVACGDVPAETAVRLGLATGIPGPLDALCRGPLPFSHEYF